MQISEFIKKHDLSLSQLAALCKISYHQLYYIHRGGNPKLEVAQKIVKATKGGITFDDLLAERRD